MTIPAVGRKDNTPRCKLLRGGDPQLMSEPVGMFRFFLAAAAGSGQPCGSLMRGKIRAAIACCTGGLYRRGGQRCTSTGLSDQAGDADSFLGRPVARPISRCAHLLRQRRRISGNPSDRKQAGCRRRTRSNAHGCNGNAGWSHDIPDSTSLLRAAFLTKMTFDPRLDWLHLRGGGAA
jgi:hypothetical protein